MTFPDDMRPRMPLYVLKGHEVEPIEDFDEWSRQLVQNRVVARTQLIDGSTVSTLFLGVGFPGVDKPMLFETALVTEDSTEVVARYATWGEAEAGHMDWLDRCVAPERIVK